MKWDEYIKASARTDNATTLDEAWDHYTLGLLGESGEVCEVIKKHIFYGRALDVAHLTEEIGDVLWYLAALHRRWPRHVGPRPSYHQPEGLVRAARYLAQTTRAFARARPSEEECGLVTRWVEDVLWAVMGLCEEAGIDLAEVLACNVIKLQIRHPEGLTKEASQRREA